MNPRASDSNIIHTTDLHCRLTSIKMKITNKNIIVAGCSSVAAGLLPATLYCCKGEGRAAASGSGLPPPGGSERKRERRATPPPSPPASPLWADLRGRGREGRTAPRKDGRAAPPPASLQRPPSGLGGSEKKREGESRTAATGLAAATGSLPPGGSEWKREGGRGGARLPAGCHLRDPGEEMRQRESEWGRSELSLFNSYTVVRIFSR